MKRGNETAFANRQQPLLADTESPVDRSHFYSEHFPARHITFSNDAAGISLLNNGLLILSALEANLTRTIAAQHGMHSRVVLAEKFSRSSYFYCGPHSYSF